MQYNKAKINSVVTLSNKENITRKTAIHSNKGMVRNSGELKFECENFHHDDTVSLILLSEGILDEEVELLDGKYKIDEIINIHTYFFRFCLEKLQHQFPDHGYFITHTVTDTEELAKQMKETIKVNKDERNKKLEFYNFGVNIGTPISYLSGKNIDTYADTLFSLLYQKDQQLYTGEVTLHNEREYVFSISSLILMSSLDLLNRLDKVNGRYFVSPEIIKAIEVGIKESNKNTQLSAGFITLSDEDQLSGYTYSEDDKRAKRKLWTSLRIAISKLTVQTVNNEDNDIYDQLSELCLEAD